MARNGTPSTATRTHGCSRDRVVSGVGGDATNVHVLDSLLELKGRNAEKGLGLLASASEWPALVTSVWPAVVLQGWGGPLTAMSASLAGQAPCRTSSEAERTFDADSPIHVVEGEGAGGRVSTLLRLNAGRPDVLSVGAVAEEVLTRFIASTI